MAAAALKVASVVCFTFMFVAVLCQEANIKDDVEGSN